MWGMGRARTGSEGLGCGPRGSVGARASLGLGLRLPGLDCPSGDSLSP